MKKILFLILCIYSFEFAQGQQMSAGSKAGINFSSLTADNSEVLTGINAGGFFVYSIVEHFGVSIDLLYSSEGADYTSQTTLGDALLQYRYKVRLNYIRTPLLANVYFGKLGDKVRPKILVGPSFGFLVGAKNEFTLTTNENGTITTATFVNKDTDDYSSNDIGIVFGGGLNFRLSDKTWLNLDARYNLGITDIIELNNDDPVKNNVWSVDLGLGFALD